MLSLLAPLQRDTSWFLLRLDCQDWQEVQTGHLDATPTVYTHLLSFLQPSQKFSYADERGSSLAEIAGGLVI